MIKTGASDLLEEKKLSYSNTSENAHLLDNDNSYGNIRDSNGIAINKVMYKLKIRTLFPITIHSQERKRIWIKK
jgi:hypothetical protein